MTGVQTCALPISLLQMIAIPPGLATSGAVTRAARSLVYNILALWYATLCHPTPRPSIASLTIIYGQPSLRLRHTAPLRIPALRPARDRPRPRGRPRPPLAHRTLPHRPQIHALIPHRRRPRHLHLGPALRGESRPFVPNPAPAPVADAPPRHQLPDSGTPSPAAFAVLLTDAAHLLRPRRIAPVNSSAAARPALLVLSDIAALFPQRLPKLHFYAAHLCAQDAAVLERVAAEAEAEAEAQMHAHAGA